MSRPDSKRAIRRHHRRRLIWKRAKSYVNCNQGSYDLTSSGGNVRYHFFEGSVRINEDYFRYNHFDTMHPDSPRNTNGDFIEMEKRRVERNIRLARSSLGRMQDYDCRLCSCWMCAGPPYREMRRKPLFRWDWRDYDLDGPTTYYIQSCLHFIW